jgi:hypothetical protein
MGPSTQQIISTNINKDNIVFNHPVALIYLDTQYNSIKNATTLISPSSHDVSATNGHLQVSQLCQNCSTVHLLKSHVTAIFHDLNFKILNVTI